MNEAKIQAYAIQYWRKYPTYLKNDHCEVDNNSLHEDSIPDDCDMNVDNNDLPDTAYNVLEEKKPSALSIGNEISAKNMLQNNKASVVHTYMNKDDMITESKGVQGETITSKITDRATNDAG